MASLQCRDLGWVLSLIPLAQRRSYSVWSCLQCVSGAGAACLGGPNVHINQWKSWHGQNMFNEVHKFYSLSIQSFVVN